MINPSVLPALTQPDPLLKRVSDTSRNRWNFVISKEKHPESESQRHRERMSENKGRTIKLLCPSLPTTVQLVVADEEQKLDLGSIAGTFGVDPWTVKLNGHFIARGTDLIASSVTWKSLLSFFSAKGLPTGKNDDTPIVVDGKLCRVGAKRSKYTYQVSTNA